MKAIFLRLCAVLAVIGLVGVFAPAAEAQQVNPTAASVTEDALFDALGTGDRIAGRISIPDGNAANVISPANREWAGLHQGAMQTLSIVMVVAAIVVLAGFYMIRGKIMIDAGPSGQRIRRFNAVERFGHWMLASTFIVLAITGLNIVLGRQLLLPLIGENAFGSLSQFGKLAHNYLAWPFMAALVLVFLLWVGRNIPHGRDWTWLMAGGGLFKKGVHPPAGKFNAGQKLIFWSVILGGAALSVTGFFLLFPAEAGADWQFYQVIHGVVAAVLSFIIIAHIYIGSIGMEGAFDAMGSGDVDLNWAKEHHSIWVQEVLGPDAAGHHGARATPAE